MFINVNLCQVGYLMTITNTVKIAMLILFLPLGTRVLHYIFNETSSHISGVTRTDMFISRAGIWFDAIGYVICGLARNGTGYSIGRLSVVSGEISELTIQASLTNAVPKENIGEFIGGETLAVGVAYVIFTSLGMWLYSISVKSNPALLFFVAAAGYVINNAVSLWIRTGSYDKKDYDTEN